MSILIVITAEEEFPLELLGNRVIKSIYFSQFLVSIALVLVGNFVVLESWF